MPHTNTNREGFEERFEYNLKTFFTDICHDCGELAIGMNVERVKSFIKQEIERAEIEQTKYILDLLDTNHAQFNEWYKNWKKSLTPPENN